MKRGISHCVRTAGQAPELELARGHLINLARAFPGRHFGCRQYVAQVHRFLPHHLRAAAAAGVSLSTRLQWLDIMQEYLLLPVPLCLRLKQDATAASIENPEQARSCIGLVVLVQSVPPVCRRSLLTYDMIHITYL